MRINRFLMILIMVLTGLGVGRAFQAPGGREGNSPAKSKDANKPRSQPKTAKKTPVPKPKKESSEKESPVSLQTDEEIPAPQPKREERTTEVPKPLTAEVMFTVSPLDSVVQFEGEDFQRYAQNGVLNVTGIKPGSYSVKIRSSKHHEQTLRLQLQQGVNSPINVSLIPLNGLLRVTTNVNGATIVVKNHGTYNNIVDNLLLSPGKYQIEVAKNGYETFSREVEVYPDETTIEPVTLERKGPPRTGDIMSTHKEVVKGNGPTHWMIELTGTSGDVESKSGSLNVLIMPNDKGFPTTVNVMRMLSGMPCRVYPIPLDNIKDIVIELAPGQANQWGKIRINVYPKNTKERVKFDIRWQSIEVANESTQSNYSTQSGDNSYPVSGVPAPSTIYRNFRSEKFFLKVPDNWQEETSTGKDFFNVVFSAPGAKIKTANRNDVTHGMFVTHYKGYFTDLKATANRIVDLTLQNNTYLRKTSELVSLNNNGKQGYGVILTGTYQITNKTEVVKVYVFMLGNNEILSISIVNPEDEESIYHPVFTKILNSLVLL